MAWHAEGVLRLSLLVLIGFGYSAAYGDSVHI